MAVGDKEATVIACVNAVLKARGYDPPYDPNGTMNGRYRYQFETMVLFHRQVKTCLAAKGYAYVYEETQQYINQTLVMTLAQIYATIAVRTTVEAHFELESANVGIPVESVARVVRAAKKASKPRQAKKVGPRKRGKAKKRKTAKKRAVKRVAKKKAATRGRKKK
jgi:hypothetical protein